MYLLFPGASLTIARNLIRVTGTPEIWATLRQESTSKAPPRNLWREVLGLNVCNLAQTMAEGSVDRELDPEDRQDVLEDFVMEILRSEKWVPTQDGAERMELCMEVLAVAERLKPHFSRTRIAQGLRPRQEAVRDLLFSLGMEKESGLQKTLTALIDTQHQRFVGYFKGLFEPFREEEDGPQEGADPPMPPGQILLEPKVLDGTVVPAELPLGTKAQSPPAVLEEVQAGPETLRGPEVQAGLGTPMDLEAPVDFESPAVPSSVLVEPLDLDPLTVTPLNGMPTLLEPPAEEPAAVETALEGDEGSAAVIPDQEVVEAVSESWVEEGAALPQEEAAAAPEAEPTPHPPASPIQPVTRPRSSLGRSVDPQKLAKVLEYLLSPSDSPPPDLSPELNKAMGLEDVGAVVDAPAEGNVNVGASEPPTTEGPPLPEGGEEGPSLSAETQA